MNIQETFGRLHASFFRVLRAVSSHLPGGRIKAFGTDPGQIGAIMVINLERQPLRLRRTMRELKRFRTASGASLISITERLNAVDARDGRDVASIGDVDPEYVLGDQLYVQPDERLEHCFGRLEPITMTRQEVAVARSHIEAWKSVATGDVDHVLIVEDDIWFRAGARSAIDRGWRAARSRFTNDDGPDLLYLSYLDAGGTAVRKDVCRDAFRPERGLWFLSGYVLSRLAARKLLLAMPVKGPVDMWMNRRFVELRTMALSEPAILQRRDSGSDNNYSVMPYLARAGVIDADAVALPPRASVGPLFVWCGEDAKQSVAMAISMLGLRVRVFDECEPMIRAEDVPIILADFDALIEPRLDKGLFGGLSTDTQIKFIFESIDRVPLELRNSPRMMTRTFASFNADSDRWTDLCNFLGLATPTEPFPVGTPPEWRLFRDDRNRTIYSGERAKLHSLLSDDSAWALKPAPEWPQFPDFEYRVSIETDIPITSPSPNDLAHFDALEETFPGNLASFNRQCISWNGPVAVLTLRGSSEPRLSRPFISGALASSSSFQHGRFEAEIKAARGAGLVTGFFLHRSSPKQEIDFEITGDDPTSVLLNVYFNPGDAGANANYGYRGSPCRIPLGFDASAGFHRYSIVWRPDSITWVVDGCVLHRRGSWDPTPIPHLPMKVHLNLWSPRSKELAGSIELQSLPALAAVKNVCCSVI